MIMLGKHQLVVQPPENNEESTSIVSVGEGFNAGQEETIKDNRCPATPTASNSGEMAAEEER